VLAAILLACLPAHPSAQAPAADLPFVGRVGLAWERKAEPQPALLQALEDLQRAMGDAQPGRLIALQVWDDAARRRAEQEGLDLVLVLERAKAEVTKPVTEEYADEQGRTARLRYSGATWDVRGSLRARASAWTSVDTATSAGETFPPWTISREHLGGKVDTQADPQVELARGIEKALDVALDRFGARVLWQSRELWREAGTADPTEHSPWPWVVVAGGTAWTPPLPRASLLRRARADLASWQAHWNVARSGAQAAGRCGWCDKGVDDEQECSCEQASALTVFLGGVRVLISVKGGAAESPLKGLAGSDPRTVFARAPALDAALAERDERGRSLLRAPWESRFVKREVLVLLYADTWPPELVEGVDPDLCSVADSLALSGVESIASHLENWKLRAEPPSLLLVRVEGHISRAKVQRLESLRLAKAGPTQLQALLEQALAATLAPAD
jgi:hypothetical protein